MTPNSSPALRIGDAERERTVAVLRRAVGEGRLTLAEGDERMATAYASRTAADLAPLLADLPPHRFPSSSARGPDSPGALRRHLAFVIAVSALLIVAWFASDAPFFWPVWPIGFLVFGLVRHARGASATRAGRWS